MPVLVLLIFIVCCTTFVNSIISRTSQQLPGDCWSAFKGRSQCPDFGTDSSKQAWERLNKTCCSGFTGQDLHCQYRSFPNGTEVLYPACVTTRRIERGYTVELVINTADYPELKINPCNEKFYEPHVRNSYEIVSPNVCSFQKHDCQTEIGQMLLCKGTTTEDSMCVCDSGHVPVGERQCREGFNHDAACSCDPCELGKVRNITRGHPLGGSCGAVKVVTGNYTCVSDVDAKTTTTIKEESTLQDESYTTTLSTFDVTAGHISHTIPFCGNVCFLLIGIGVGTLCSVVLVLTVLKILKKFFPDCLRPLQKFLTTPAPTPQCNGAEVKRMTEDDDNSTDV